MAKGAEEVEVERQRKEGGRELKERGAKRRAEKMKRGRGETMCSAADNYTRKLAEGMRERDGQRDKLIIIIFSMLVVITIIIMAINITVTTVTARGKNWMVQSALDQSAKPNVHWVCVCVHVCIYVVG